MITIRDLLNLAFMAGRIAGHVMASNILSEDKKPVETFEDFCNNHSIFDLDVEIKLKPNQ
jgi:hypothetical protein